MDGIILIDKPKGWTSFDVVAKVRNVLRTAQYQEILGVSHVDGMQGTSEKRSKSYKRYDERAPELVTQQSTTSATGMAPPWRGQQSSAVRKIRVGHTGTLDPMATGLLVLLIGNYTKKAPELAKLDKTYEVTMKLGETSSTGDSEGLISAYVSNKNIKNKTEKISYFSHMQKIGNYLTEVIDSFVGEIMQTPPAFSAVKVNGKRAYKLAREGKEVKIEPRKVTIYDISNLLYSYPYIEFTAKVSSGTYIRSLVQDIGEKLGTGAYMSDLRRTAVGNFNIKNSVKVSEFSSDTMIESTRL